MEWFTEGLSECVFALLGIALTLLASRIGALAGRLAREKLQDERVREVAATCVRAVEQMYKDRSGKEKLEKALLMGEKLLMKKGIRIGAQELRVVLEAALSEAKGAFREK
ncbi:MAG: hypothetical protein E7580_07775 [Ruminococcaceae bacterium]|nr:hypothetical protein [Oscillospiraceae bacterium]